MYMREFLRLLAIAYISIVSIFFGLSIPCCGKDVFPLATQTTYILQFTKDLEKKLWMPKQTSQNIFEFEKFFFAMENHMSIESWYS